MLFSVIVPVYGVEAYLRQCVDSVLSQSDRDWELILVDDGSPDGCPAICDEYAVQDGRVRVLHQPNGGPTAARKTGLAVAQGEYVVYVDGDDWLAQNALVYLRGLVERHHPDVILSAKRREYTDHASIMKERLPEGFYDGEAMKTQIEPLILMDENMKNLCWYQIGSAVRRTLLLPCQMAVEDGLKLGEDMLCMTLIYEQMRSVYISHQPVYHYRMRKGSLSNGIHDAILDQFLYLLHVLRSMEKEQRDDFSERVNRYIGFTCCVFLERAAAAKARRELDRLERRLLGEPIVREGLLNARFGQIGLKRKTILWLMKRDKLRLAYGFLRVYDEVKKPIKAVLKRGKPS